MGAHEKDDPADPAVAARMRALSSPLRLRILRLCAFEARTNKQLAEILGMNPGTMLHHVRTLARTGLLAAQTERAGAQGAREVPYLATGLSWRTPLPAGSPMLVDTFLDGLDGVDADRLDVAWLGLKLNDAHRAELADRIEELLEEFKARAPDPDGEAFTLFTALHPDRPSGNS